LNREHKEDGLAVIGLSFDSPDDKDGVLEYLKSAGATFDNVIDKGGGDLESFKAYGIPGGLPFYKLYDRQGVLRYQFCPLLDGVEKGEPVEKIDQRVNELLAEEATES
jgi:hypothetical protein